MLNEYGIGSETIQPTEREMAGADRVFVRTNAAA
jgi:hypothetical protein